MVHVFLNDGDGVVLRSRFWFGSAHAPLPRPLPRRSSALNTTVAPALPADFRSGRLHCIEEYANLAELLPSSTALR